MIRNQWYVVLESREVGRKPVGVTRLGEKLVFWRDSTGGCHCLRDQCVHRGVALSKGWVCDDHLVCPFHGFEYDASGRIQYIPANGRKTPVPEAFRAPGYPVHEAHGLIWIWWGELPPPDLTPPPFFDDLDETFSYASAYDPWQVHYSRVIENQLDVVHLPFIHTNTIGRGNRTVVDGPVVRWVREDLFYVYVFNRLDDGSPPRRADQIPIDPEPPFKLEFQFPNLWQNHISPQVRILAAFVPVDENHTLLYLRFYQRFVRLPLLREVVNLLAMPFNLYVAHQDRRVVETHRVGRSGLRIGEQLIRGDQPIIEYRRKREEMLREAGGGE
ncbi:MAG: Rieske 2Fe-2S domain-containing protein [Chloroflexota bacterium]